MSNIELALWSFPVLLVLVFLRAPIALAMIGVGVGGTYLVIGSSHDDAEPAQTLTYGTFSNYSFSIIPLFLLMGQFATLSGMSASLFRAAESFLGHRRWRCHVRRRGLRRVWCDLRIILGDSGHDGTGRPARTAPLWLSRIAGHWCAGRRWSRWAF